MNCPKCGAPYEQGDKFCADCSEPLPVTAGAASNQPTTMITTTPAQAQTTPVTPAPAAPHAAGAGGNFVLFKVPGSTTTIPATQPTPAAVPQNPAPIKVRGMTLFQVPTGVAEPQPVGIPRNCDCGATPDRIGPDRLCKDCGEYGIIPVRDDFYVKVDGDANRLVVRSNLGKRHWRNEDYGKMISETINGERYTWIVFADGVSQSQNPDQASEGACKAGSDAVRQSLKANKDKRAALDAAVAAAQKAVLVVPFTPQRTEKDLPGPESTLVVCIIHDGTADIAWIADSRAYVFMRQSDGKLSGQAVTKDQSWANAMVDSGKMTMEEALASPNAHVITQSLGQLEEGQTLAPSYNTVKLDNAVCILVCSDGFYQYTNPDPALPPTEMLELLTKFEKDALGFANACIGFANESGGTDNITVCAAFLPIAA